MTQVATTNQKAPPPIVALLSSKKSQIVNALPQHLKFERFAQMAMVEYGRNKDIAECDPMTVLGSIVKAATLGLEISNDLGHCYLVAFNNRKTGVKECQMIPGYKGYMDLARRGQEGCEVMARAVYEKDKFDYEFGLTDRLVHKPSTEANPGPLTHVYAVATFKNGIKKFDVMNISEIEHAKSFSKTKSWGPWVDHYEAMAKKAVVRRLAKFLPLNPQFAEAQAIDDAESQENWRVIDAEYEPEKTVAPTVHAEMDQEVQDKRTLEMRKAVYNMFEALEKKDPNNWLKSLGCSEVPNLDKMDYTSLEKLAVKCKMILK